MMNRYRIGILIVMALIVAACGSKGGGLGDVSAPASTDMTADQATAFAQSISKISTSSMPRSPVFSGAAISAETSQLRTVSCNQAGSCQINEPISYTLTCTSGGNMKASGSITGTMTNGTGVISLQIPITISDWSCEPPAIINGDPYISITGTFSFVNGSPGTQQHISVSGGFKSAAQSCQILLGTDFNPSGGGHTSGTCCGHSVDFTF